MHEQAASPAIPTLSAARPGLDGPPAGLALSCAGATLVCFALLVYPPLQRRVGPHKACRLGLACAAPCVLLVPTTSLLPL